MESLKEYAALENQLSRLLAASIKTDFDVATLILYSVSNTRARYKIISGALRLNFEETYYRSWKRVEEWLGPRDTARNHIVHWGEDERIVVAGDSIPAEVIRSTVLTNNATRAFFATFEKSYGEAEIRSETRANRCMKHIINRRYWLSMFEPTDWPWTDIFQQPITHQNPEEFLQLLNARGIPAQL